MLWRPGLQSYAVQMVKGKVILFVLLSFLAAKGHLVAASSASRGLPLNASFQISIQLSQTPWSEDFFNNKSAMFVALATNLTTAVSDVIKTVGNGTVEVVEFTPGSVIAVMKVTASSLHEKAMKAKLESEMKDGVLGGFSVDQTLYSGTIFDVILKVKFSCNDSLPDKGFIQKEELVNAISSGLSGNHEVLNASIHGIECSEADNITMVTARVQINDPLAANPYKELSGLKSQIDSSKLGSFSVVPEWKSYIPGEKVFYVRVSLNTGSTNTTQTRQQLKQFIEDDFKGDSKFRYVHVIMPDNTSAIIEIGMRSSTSPILSLALTPIRQDLGNGKLGNVLLNKGLNRVTIDMKSLTRKIFEVSFIKYVSSCVDADVANPSSSHYKELSQKFTQFIDTNMKAHQLNSQFYLSTEVIKLKCENSTSVEGYSYVYMKPSTEDKIANLNGALYKCNTEPGIFDNGLTISLRTPTTPDAKGRWSSTLDGVSLTRGSCLKPKPPDPTNPSPTAPPTTTEPPTQVSTTDNRTTAPTTENQTITPGFSSTKPQTITTIKPVVTSETTTSPTTKVVLPTLPKEPELYVKVKLGLTWGEFCSIQHVFKERIAWNVRDQNDTRVSPDRIIYVNVERNCADPSKNDELADVWFYLSKPGSQEADESLTSKAYELFKMFFENGNTRQLGPYFEEKVLQIELAGNKASRYEKETGIMMPSWLIILLAVAGAVGLFLMLLACCCLFCCGATRRRRKRKYDPEQPQVLKVVHVDSNGSVIRGSGQKNGKENNQVIDTKKEQAGDGKHIKDDGDKDGYNNGGFESDNNNKSPDGKQNCAALEGQEGKSPKAGHETKALNGSSENTYQSLNKTDDLGDHSYASVNKPGSTTEGKGNDDKSNNATHAAMMAPVTGGGSKGSGSGGGKNKNGGSSDFNSSRATNIEDNVRYVTTTAPVTSGGIKGSGASDSKSNSDGSQPDVNSSRAGNNGNSQDSQSGSKASPTSFTKTDVSPKGDERRGSRARSFVEEDVPLTHKTGTVGIVALAIRNKNETKKEREFKNLDKDIPNEEVKYPPDTTSKNRYSDALPAPRTRVKLSTSPDYINANWIRDHKGQACYIATQHPLQATAGDFWRMVWDQKTHTVVMVNNEEKEKPAEFMDYLPKGEGNTKQFGGFDVTIKQIIEKPDYVLTVLSIAEGKNTASSREVSYMKFTSWKERVMPNVALFVGFVSATREARKKYGDTKAPTIVHCSDGLGFTGVYIAVDIGIKSHEESKNSVVDVFEMSKNLRRDRHGIVSTLEHYNFIYQALYEYTVNYNKLAE